jgi:hypothetical protein
VVLSLQPTAVHYCWSLLDKVSEWPWRKAALRSAATRHGADLGSDGIRGATLTIAGQIVAGTVFDPEHIAVRCWEVVHSDGPWQAEFPLRGNGADFPLRQRRASIGLCLTDFSRAPDRS